MTTDLFSYSNFLSNFDDLLVSLEEENENGHAVLPRDGKHLTKAERRMKRYEQIIAARRIKRNAEHRKHRLAQKEKAKLHKSSLVESVPSSFVALSICIDLSFDNAMSDKESASLARQLGRVWSCQKRFAGLSVTLLSPTERLLRECRRIICGFDAFTWKIVDDSEADDLLETQFPSSELVYLSPDAEMPLTELQPDTNYVIGGLVDESGKGAMSKTKADRLGIKCRRLPIAEHLIRETGGTYNLMLTINQVVEILARFAHSGDWTKSLGEVVPKRTGYRS